MTWEDKIDRCHEATEFDHRCVICDPDQRGCQLHLLRRYRDELTDRIERHGTAMTAEEHFRAYDELEAVILEVRWLEFYERQEGGEL